ncbi:unnamed protein product [Nesidiocoris tenuis]|uniref:Uncharacterized protein n=1 Tax=Nesidiocoris tenuis TaxID=355587 RepID=A0A6H5H0I2_9HEMI|nr:unnamed protein product [Nesidiocoris tenuis]
MKAMTELRNLLSRSTGAQVLDLWDRGMKDKIDTTGDTWALRYLLDEDVQAVVVASPGSVRVEQAILNDENVTYDVPDSRDETFTSAFKTVIRMTHTQKDRCWKIIVVRCSFSRKSGFNENGNYKIVNRGPQRKGLNELFPGCDSNGQQLTVVSITQQKDKKATEADIEKLTKQVLSWIEYEAAILRISKFRTIKGLT